MDTSMIDEVIGLTPEAQDLPKEDDPFLGPEQFLDDEQEDGADPDQQEDQPADSARYFQSMYDKSQAALQQQTQQMQLIQQQMLMMQQQMQGGQPAVNPGQASGTSQESLGKPERPQKPSRYDAIDATSDPNSESWAYREQMESYQERMADYMDGLQQQTLRQTQQFAEQQAAKARVDSVRSQLNASYGMSNEEIEDFWRTMDDPTSLELPNLVKLYKIIKGQPIQAQPRSRMPVAPVPTLRGVSQQQQTGSLETRIMDDMIRKQESAIKF